MLKNKYLMLGIFLIGFLLIISSVDSAQCVVSIADEYIDCGTDNPSCEFGIKEEINDVTLNFKLREDKDDVPVSIFLCKTQECEKTDRLSSKSGVSQQDGEFFKVDINCDTQTGVCLDTSKVLSSSLNYYIKAIIDPSNPFTNPNGLNQEVIRQINFKKILEVKLNCPIEAFAGSDILCTFTVEDAENPTSLISFTPSVSISQGDKQLTSNLGIDSLTFTSNILGDVVVELRAGSGGFLDGEDITQVIISLPEKKETLLIDGKTLSSFAGQGVLQGTHDLTLKFEKGNELLDVNSLELIMETPSGEVLTLTPQRINEGTFKTNFNFQQSGTTYVLKGTVNPEDVGELPFKFENNILIVGEITEEFGTSLLLIGIGVAVAVIVIIITMIFIFRVVGRRKG